MNKNKALLFKNKYRIESIRLKNWDYSDPGFYFVTICTKDRKNIFGEIVDGKMVLNKYGYIVKYCWRDLPNHYKNCIVDSYIIMPNHFHGIIRIKNVHHYNNVEMGFKPISDAGYKPASTWYKQYSLFEMIRGFKTFSSKKITRLRQRLCRGENLVNHAIYFRWQKSYYEHIIRNEQSLYRIRQYIKNNPINWDVDRNFKK